MNAGLTHLVDNGKLDQQVAKGVADLLDDEQDEQACGGGGWVQCSQRWVQVPERKQGHVEGHL